MPEASIKDLIKEVQEDIEILKEYNSTLNNSNIKITTKDTDWIEQAINSIEELEELEELDKSDEEDYIEGIESVTDELRYILFEEQIELPAILEELGYESSDMSISKEYPVTQKFTDFIMLHYEGLQSNVKSSLNSLFESITNKIQ